ncbi:LysM peptidoglycan-binding domain-containing protein [Marinicrinis sediminis]|uniref:LysM peptidoglycan-binding domain-containing protein n=1 Tax=Marinicrinis sediminis TaxID=1652465 RepID=A0ABW5R7N3_9BACL
MNANLEFWLSFRNYEEQLQLPVNPVNYELSSSHDYQDFEVNHYGERTVPGFRQLAEISLSSFFPKHYNATFCEYENIPQPWEAVNRLKRWQESGEPIRLKITGTSINMAATIRSLDIEEKAGEPGDIHFSLKLKEYQFFTFPVYALDEEEKVIDPSQRRANTVVNPSRYTVKPGDSLWKISQKNLGDGSKWRKIYELNKAVIGPNPNLIKPQQVLVMPS